MATEQAGYALASLSRALNGASGLYDMTDIDIKKVVNDNNKNDNKNNNKDDDKNSNKNDDKNKNNNKNNNNNNENNNNGNGGNNGGDSSGDGGGNTPVTTSGAPTTGTPTSGTPTTGTPTSGTVDTDGGGKLAATVTDGAPDSVSESGGEQISEPNIPRSAADTDTGGFPLRTLIGCIAALIAAALATILIVRHVRKPNSKAA
jgi:hypothetical protein